MIENEDELRAFAEAHPDTLTAALYRLHVAVRSAKHEVLEEFKETRLYRLLARLLGE